MGKNIKKINNPLVTVFMPVHNGQTFIKYAIESILRQTFSDFELLIINDVSDDQSVQIIRSFKDKRIRLIHNQKRLGLAKTRQRGVLQAKGKFIAFLDCDDVSLPKRLQSQIQFMGKNVNIAMVGTWVEVIDKEGKPTGKIWRHVISPEIIPAVLFFRNCFTQSSVLLKKDCFSSFSFREDFWPAPDYDLWTRLVQKYNLANIPDVLTYYRTYEGSMSNRVKEEIRQCGEKIILNNVARLGINPTKEELILHDFLERNDKSCSDEMIIKTQSWLIKLYSSNEKINIYEINAFQTIISDYWFKTCCVSANRGYDIWRKYKDFLLYKIRKNTWKRDLILFLLCLVRSSRVIDITSNSWMELTY